MKRGFFVGSALTVYRILRCHPFHPGGYDPVPEKGFFPPRVQVRLEEDIEETLNNDSDSEQNELN